MQSDLDHIGDKLVRKEKNKVFGHCLDSHDHLFWKFRILLISFQKKNPNVWVFLSKLRHYIHALVLTMLIHTLIHSFLTISVVAWGITYTTTLRPLISLQKKAVRMSFSDLELILF